VTGIPATAPVTGALTDLADLPDIADLLAGTWRQRMGSQPPADWLAHATHTLRAHVTQLLAHAQAQHADAIAQAAQSGRDELTRLRTTLRQQLADLAAEGQVEMDFANSLLSACGQPLLQRAYTVHVKVPFAVRVSAEDDDSAYQAAKDAVADALIPDGDEILASWDDVEHDGVDPGAVDTTAP
jgi:hypothetical protein